MSDQFLKRVEGDTIYITFKLPRLDASAAGTLKSELKLDQDPEVKHAEIEIGNVEFIDSSGVGVLLGIYRKLAGDDARVNLINVRPSVQLVLELLRLHRIFSIA